MARSSEAEISGHLAENIEKWRKLGISHGLEDREIDECILRTLPEHKMGRDTLGNHATKGNFEWSLRKICFTSWIVLISLLTLLCVLSTVHPPTERLIGKLTAPYTYSVMRLVRLLSLPLNRNFDLSDYFDDPCLVHNPYYAPLPLSDCQHCKPASSVRFLSHISSHKFYEEFHQQGKAFVTKNVWDSRVSFKQLQATCNPNMAQIKRGLNRVTSWNNEVNSVEHLIHNVTEQQIQEQNDFHVEWYSRRLGSSVVLRKLIKRPPFLPEESEVEVDKIVYIDNIIAPSYDITEDHCQGLLGADNVWYVQSSGTRTLQLHAVAGCHRVCADMEITLSAGQMLYYSASFWKVTSQPLIPAVPGVSLAFVATFT